MTDTTRLAPETHTLVLGFLRVADVAVVVLTALVGYWLRHGTLNMPFYYEAAVVLSGVLTRAQSRVRLQERWSVFVQDGLGCRCVAEEPWVTVAESCELTMALLAAGDHARAARLFSWLHQWRDGDGTYWTGYQWVEEVLWPLEKPTWTAGAVLLAADALTGHTAASRLFTEVDLLESPQQAERAHPRQLFVKP